MTVTYAVRRKRKSRLIRDAVSFDLDDALEGKARGSSSSSLRRGISNTGHHSGSDVKYDYAAHSPSTPAPQSAYVPPSAYNTYAQPGQYDSYDYNASQHGHGGGWDAQHNTYGGANRAYDRMSSGSGVDVSFAPTYTH